MEARLREALAAALGAEVREARPVSGGDVNRAWRVALAGGDEVFVKHRADAPPGFFEREAEGLAWLAEPAVLATPAVRAVGPPECPFLALAWVDAAPAHPDFDALLGHGLAALHASGAPAFGWERDNWIGPLPQENAPAPTWAEFYAARRLQPQLRRARDAGRLDAGCVARAERLCERLPDRVGDPEPPARLHGDLWGGNLLSDAGGRPCLVDPAVYGGHREVDLAMMGLFGGFAERAFAAYDEVFPRAPGADERVPLHQLYPLLVHVNLFGGSYAAAFERALRRCA